MNNDSNGPGQSPDNNKWKKEHEVGNTSIYDTTNKSLETNGPNTNKPFTVLNQDGSLADIPDENAEGKGALDGTVGLGT